MCNDIRDYKHESLYYQARHSELTERLEKFYKTVMLDLHTIGIPFQEIEDFIQCDANEITRIALADIMDKLRVNYKPAHAEIALATTDCQDIQNSYISFRNAAEQYANALQAYFKDRPDQYTEREIRDAIRGEMHGIVTRKINGLSYKENT